MSAAYLRRFFESGDSGRSGYQFGKISGIFFRKRSLSEFIKA